VYVSNKSVDIGSQCAVDHYAHVTWVNDATAVIFSDQCTYSTSKFGLCQKTGALKIPDVTITNQLLEAFGRQL